MFCINCLDTEGLKQHYILTSVYLISYRCRAKYYITKVLTLINFSDE